jgi:hypothetical protein
MLLRAAAAMCMPWQFCYACPHIWGSKEIFVHRPVFRLSCFVGLLLLGSMALAQTEFSADIVNESKGGSTKVYFGKDKMRFDSPDGEDRSSGGAAILDFSNNKMIVLMAKQHMYMEMPQQMLEKRGMYTFFRTGDVENACSDWLKLPENKGGACHKVGNETVNGRSTVKYEGTNSKGETGFVWIDPKLRFPVKWQGKNEVGGELRNIQEGSQPSSLFEVPAGYTKFDMGAMQQRQ